MNNFEFIDTIVSKYKSDHALPDHVRKEMIRLKKNVFINILKSVGKYTLVTACVINIILLSKKIGLCVSAIKLQVTVKTVIAMVTSTAAFTTGSAVYHHYAAEASAAVETRAVAAAPSSGPSVKTLLPTAGTPLYKFVIIPFVCPPELSGKSADLSKKTYDALIRTFGEESAVIAGSTAKYRSEYTIRGSCSKYGNNYYLSVRLISTADSRIVTIINKTAAGAVALDAETGEIIGELSELELQQRSRRANGSFFNKFPPYR
jgi:hypothetical protein